jgi:glycosyltransferase involved in cell wall biosynthesis
LNPVMKVLWLFNHPAPYKIDFFNTLGQKVDLTVIFERTSEGDRKKEFYYEKAKAFKEIILSSVKLGDYNNYCPCIIKMLKKNPADLIVVNGWSTLTEMKVLRYLKRHKIPYIFAINGGIARENEAGWKKRLKQKYLPGATLYLSPDPHSSDYLTYYGVDASKIRLYPYSTVFASEMAERPLTPAEKKAERLKEKIPGEEVYLSVGSFIPRKNDLQLLHYWTLMDPKKTLILIGNGPEEKTYREFIAEHHLSNVFIEGFRPHKEILHYFALADASLFLTKEDIYGHVVNECLSQGTPVIASLNANSARKLIQNGVNGYLLSLDNDEEIKAVLNKPITPEMGVKAIAAAKGNTIEAMSEAHLRIFEEALKA